MVGPFYMVSLRTFVTKYFFIDFIGCLQFAVGFNNFPLSNFTNELSISFNPMLFLHNEKLSSGDLFYGDYDERIRIS